MNPFGEKTFCDNTGELIDEEGTIRFYRCNREPSHGGSWHTGYEFGPNLDLSLEAGASRKPQLWPTAQSVNYPSE